MTTPRPGRPCTTTSSISVRWYSVTVPSCTWRSERLVGAEQQLLAGLAPGVERAGDLRAAERAVVEQPAVLAGERHALGDALVDDVHAHLRQPVDVRLAGAVVAALHRVVEEAVDAVAVVRVVLRRVDPALRGDGVGAPGRVVEGERLDLVAELAERRGGGGAGEPGADDDDVELALVRRVHELHVELVLVPLLGDRAVGDLGVERVVRHRLTAPVVMSSGMLHVADDDERGEPGREVRGASGCMRGLFEPRLWNMHQAPWKMWMPSASWRRCRGRRPGQRWKLRYSCRRGRRARSAG